MTTRPALHAVEPSEVYSTPLSLETKDAAFRLSGAATRLRVAVCGPYMTTAAKALARRDVAAARHSLDLMEGALS